MVEEKEVVVKGIKLICPVCEHMYFTKRITYLDSWANNAYGFTLNGSSLYATNYICVNCSYVFWFAFDDSPSYSVYGVTKHE